VATKKASTTRKTTAKKTAAKKSTSKSPTAKGPAAKKSTAKKSTAKKATGKKATAKKATGKKAPAAKASSTTSKKAPAKKAPAAKKTAKTASAKAPTKKAPAKKAVAAKKSSTKKAPATKSAVTKKTVTTVRTSIGSGIGAPPPKPPVTKKKKKTDRRVAPTVVPSRRKLQKKAEAEAAAKSPRRKIDFANPRSVAAAAASSEADADGYVFINGRRVRAISTKGAGVKKKRASRVTAEPEVPAPVAKDVSKIKTKLSKTDLTKFRDLLIMRRREIVGMVSGLETEALRSSGGNLSNMPMHMADVGTDVFEQDFTLGMAAQERELIVQIDAALQRIEDRIYGVCQATGKPIPKARLNAKPWAKYTIEAARALERGLTPE
jgi:DnaK suppressor protein